MPAPGSEPFSLRPIDEMQTINAGTTRLAGAELGDERVLLVPGLMLRVAPETRRRLLPGPEGVRILVMGGVPGAAYDRPEAFGLR